MSGVASRQEKVQRIRLADPRAGFCSLFFNALNGIKDAGESGAIPVVDYSDHDVHSFFYESSIGDNIWEYYFLPVKQVQQSFDCQGPHETRRGVGISAGAHYPGSIRPFWTHDADVLPELWTNRTRTIAQCVVGACIRVQPDVQSMVNDFYKRWFENQRVCGVCFRGNDFFYDKPTKLAHVLRCVEMTIESREGCEVVFLATDSGTILNAFYREFGSDKVVTHSRLAFDEDVPSILPPNIQAHAEAHPPFILGFNVLANILLLSKCDTIIKSCASVGECAIWFNPSLQVIDFCPTNHFRYGEDAAGRLELNSEQLRRRIWKRKPWLQVRLATLPGPIKNLAYAVSRLVMPKRLRHFIWVHLFAGRQE